MILQNQFLAESCKITYMNQSEMMYIKISQIKPGPWQVRQNFDHLDELESSIKKYGILEPLLVKMDENNEFLIIGGERRWRAAANIGLSEVPARVLDISEAEAVSVGIVENVQRSNLSPLEEARGYQLMIDAGHTHEQIAHSIGKSRPYITNTLRLLQLPKEVQMLLQEGKLNQSQARALIGQENCVEKALKVAGLKKTVRDIEQSKCKSSMDLKLIAQQMGVDLNVDVRIAEQGNGGSIVIKYKNLEQLDDIASKLYEALNVSRET